MRGEADTALEQGRARMRMDDEPGAWKDTTVAEWNGEIAGVSIGYDLTESVREIVPAHPVIKPLLDLQAPREHVDEPRELRQARDVPGLAGDVADVGDAEERHHVVLAQAPQLDVPHEDELAVADLEDGREHLLGALVVAAEDLGVRARDARRRRLQAVTVGILADRQQQLADGSLGTGYVDGQRRSSEVRGLARLGLVGGRCGGLLLLRLLDAGPEQGQRGDAGESRQGALGGHGLISPWQNREEGSCIRRRRHSVPPLRTRVEAALCA